MRYIAHQQKKNNKNIGFIEIDIPDNGMLFEIYEAQYTPRMCRKEIDTINI
jgi:hypothetical protein